jgi:dTDP-4-dehydrorhamnose reductase
VYGPDFGQNNYTYGLMRSLGSCKIMRVPHDQVSTPTYNLDLAKATIALVERGARGVFHVCGPERMDRLEFAKTVALYLGLEDKLLRGLPTSALGQKALRPLSAGLSIDRLVSLHPDLRMRSVAEGLSDCRLDLEDFLRTYI